MTRQPNPYHPGFNQPPAVLAGRDRVIEDFVEALDIAALDHRTPRPMILVGPRGVGKTVTLGELALEAGTRLSWPTIHVEAKPQAFLQDLTTRLTETAELLEGEAPARSPRRRRPRITGGSVSAGGFGLGAELQLAEDSPTDGPNVAQRLDAAFIRAAQVAIERDAGLVITLDELQIAPREDLRTLAAVLQEHVPHNWPIVVAIAALPSLRTTKGKRKLPTYLERAAWHDLGPLDAASTQVALTEPAAQAGRPLTSAATDALVELSGGYPYAIQVVGHFAWRASTGNPEITLEHAHQAKPRIEADLQQLFRSRWEDASSRERDYLHAMAHQESSGSITSREVADKLASTTPAVAYLRDRLIKKGTIYADGAGHLHFITPGMGDWIRSQHEI